MSPLFSFIVTVYNRSDTIDCCVTSLTQAEFTDFEVIFVDDASTDRSAECCRKYTDADSRFRLIRLDTNHGVGYAKNYGLQQAKGKYVFFLDSDDKISSRLLPELAESIRKYPETPIVALDHIEVTGEQERKCRIFPALKKQETRENTAFFLEQSETLLHSECWHFLFLREFLQKHHIEIPDLRYGEDVPFVVNVLYLAKTMLYIPLEFYYYYRHSAGNSLVDTAKVKERMESFLCCGNLAASFAQNGGLTLKQKEKYDYLLYLYAIEIIPSMTAGELLPSEEKQGPASPTISLVDFYSKNGPNAMIAYVWNSYWSRLIRLTENFNKAVYLCPAGARARAMASLILQNGGRVDGFLDNFSYGTEAVIFLNDKKVSRKIDSFDILNHEEIKKKLILSVFCVTNAEKEITEQLRGFGMKKGRDFLSGFSANDV